MAQCISVQVGQCGNQIGQRFWQLALHEHAQYDPQGLYTDSLSTFFRNVDPKSGASIPVGQGRISALRARGLLVDMEESVVNASVREPLLRELFEQRQLLRDVSGSGNNWAVGYEYYGHQRHGEELLEKLRHEVEMCDAVQAFVVCHSLGGGTGSGLGSFVVEQMAEYFPHVERCVIAVCPSKDDDVITSPYNSVLSLHHLTEFGTLVLPVDNQSLLDICRRVAMTPTSEKSTSVEELSSRMQSTDFMSPASKTNAQRQLRQTGTAVTDGAPKQSSSKPFDQMNNIVARLWLNLTAAMRFEGSLNVDMNELATNLVPLPRLHYLMSSLAPLFARADVGQRKVDQMFTDAFSREHQLLHVDPRRHRYLACALLARGQMAMSDLKRNIDKIRSQLDFVYWNPDGWKTGHCHVPPLGQKQGLLVLANNCCFADTLDYYDQRFMKLYKRKAHVHHYAEYMDVERLDLALESLRQVSGEYRHWANVSAPENVLLP